jgi:hypothetical protein
MKDKLIAFTVLALLIVGSALLHVSPAIAIAMIAEGGELARALGTALLVCSMSGLIFLHSLNGSFRSKKKA